MIDVREPSVDELKEATALVLKATASLQEGRTLFKQYAAKLQEAIDLTLKAANILSGSKKRKV